MCEPNTHLHDTGAQEALRPEAQHLLPRVGEADEGKTLLLLARLRKKKKNDFFFHKNKQTSRTRAK